MGNDSKLNLQLLIERIEKASEGSRELDWEIYEATNGVELAEFTRSIDAAMTLVPAGPFKKVATGSGTVRSFAQIVKLPSGPFGGVRRASIYTRAATPALALCAAALRATREKPS